MCMQMTAFSEESQVESRGIQSSLNSGVITWYTITEFHQLCGWLFYLASLDILVLQSVDSIQGPSLFLPLHVCSPRISYICISRLPLSTLLMQVFFSVCCSVRVFSGNIQYVAIRWNEDHSICQIGNLSNTLLKNVLYFSFYLIHSYCIAVSENENGTY